MKNPSMKNPEKIILLISLWLCAQSVNAAELQGILSWPRPASMGFVVDGAVAVSEVQPGTRVNKGQLLVQLEQQAFELELKKYRAATETIEPLLFDSSVELNQAQELYDRTVLSQVELQKVEARHRGLQAQSRVADMDYQLSQWRLKKSSLRAPFDAMVIDNQFAMGQVITEYNRGQLAVRLAPVGVMGVSLLVDARTLSELELGQSVQVVVGDETFQGSVRQLDLQGNDQGQYGSVIEFKYQQDKAYYAGQSAKVIY